MFQHFVNVCQEEEEIKITSESKPKLNNYIFLKNEYFIVTQKHIDTYNEKERFFMIKAKDKKMITEEIKGEKEIQIESFSEPYLNKFFGLKNGYFIVTQNHIDSYNKGKGFFIIKAKEIKNRRYIALADPKVHKRYDYNYNDNDNSNDSSHHKTIEIPLNFQEDKRFYYDKKANVLYYFLDNQFGGEIESDMTEIISLAMSQLLYFYSKHFNSKFYKKICKLTDDKQRKSCQNSKLDINCHKKTKKK